MAEKRTPDSQNLMGAPAASRRRIQEDEVLPVLELEEELPIQMKKVTKGPLAPLPVLDEEAFDLKEFSNSALAEIKIAQLLQASPALQQELHKLLKKTRKSAPQEAAKAHREEALSVESSSSLRTDVNVEGIWTESMIDGTVSLKMADGTVTQSPGYVAGALWIILDKTYLICLTHIPPSSSKEELWAILDPLRPL